MSCGLFERRRRGRSCSAATRAHLASVHRVGTRALLACPAEEEYDLGLSALALLLRREGCRVVDIGADTPMSTLADAVEGATAEVAAAAGAIALPLDLGEPAARLTFEHAR